MTTRCAKQVETEAKDEADTELHNIIFNNENMAFYQQCSHNLFSVWAQMKQVMKSCTIYIQHVVR